MRLGRRAPGRAKRLLPPRGHRPSAPLAELRVNIIGIVELHEAEASEG